MLATGERFTLVLRKFRSDELTMDTAESVDDRVASLSFEAEHISLVVDTLSVFLTAHDSRCPLLYLSFCRGTWLAGEFDTFA